MRRQNISIVKQSILILLLLIFITIFIVLSPIPQPIAYMHFVDSRHFFGIPYFNNIMSNILFAIVGILGVANAGPYQSQFERYVYQLFFLSVFLVSLGSSYFHWEPTFWSLLWDRLPITVAMTCFLTIMLAERVSVNLAKTCWIPLLVFGLFSACYWYITEIHGHGDLRLYLLTQLFPAVFVPALLLLNRKIRSGYLWLAIACYLLARISEHFDQAVYYYTYHLTSGHTLKHLLMGVGIFLIYLHKRNRDARTNYL